MNLTVKTLGSLATMRENAVKALAKNAHNSAAHDLLQRINRELQARYSEPIDGWSHGEQGEPRFYRVRGEVVAMVIRLETHGHYKGSYLIEVHGRALDQYPRHVEDARGLAEAAIAVIPHQKNA